MRKIILTAAFMLLFSSLTGQEKGRLLSLVVEDRTIIEILSEIEAKTDYQFYFAESWLKGTALSKNYENMIVEDILNDLFENTDINFFISWDNRIIITQNNRIYDELPDGFLDEQSPQGIEESAEENLTTPALYGRGKQQAITASETIRIGKERSATRQNRFTLTGKIINVKTRKPIPDAAVVVKALRIGVVTDADGSYKIELPSGLNAVEISSLGIAGAIKNVIIYSDGKLDFELEESFEELDEVIVQGDAIRNIEDTSTGNTRIDAESSKNIPLVLGERDVLKIATTLPGVTTAGEGSAGFNVRGGKTDQNLILLDNAVLYNPSHFFGFFQAINPFSIKDLNIYKGSIPAEFGGRLSSVFEISSKDASTEKFKGEVSIGPVTGNAVVEVPIIKNKAGLLLGVRGAYSDWVLKALKDEKLNNSQASFYDFIAKYNHQINEDNQISLTAYTSGDIFSITSDSLFNYNNRLLSVKYNRKLSEKSAGSIILNNSQYKFKIDFDGSVNSNFEQSFQINETELKAQFKYLLNESHNFDYGISGKLYSVSPGEIQPRGSNDIIRPFVIPKEKALEAALFISDNIKLSDKLQVDLGLRYSFYAAIGPSEQRVYQNDLPKSENTIVTTEVYEDNDFFQTYGGPELRASARYLVNDSLSVKASFNNTYQFIHTLTNNTTVSPVDTWKLSDTNIKPQQASQFSLGIYQNLSDYEFSLEGFYKKQKNITDFKTGAQLQLNANIETEILQGKGKSYGVEFLIRKNRGKLNGWLGYTYTRSLFKLDSEFQQERVNNGEFFPSNFDKPHDVSLVLNYKLTRRFSFSGNFLYQTGRPVTFPVGNYEFDGNEFVLYSDRNQFRIPDYYRLDLSFNIEGNHKIKKFAHSFWSISVYNVLGRNNPYSVFFVSQEGEVKALQSSIFAIPIPSITYNFKF